MAKHSKREETSTEEESHSSESSYSESEATTSGSESDVETDSGSNYTTESEESSSDSDEEESTDEGSEEEGSLTEETDDGTSDEDSGTDSDDEAESEEEESVKVPVKKRKANASAAEPESGAESYTVFVGSLPYDATEADIRKAFKAVRIASVRIILDKKTGRSKGIAYLDVSSKADHDAAIGLNGKAKVGGRTLNIDSASATAKTFANKTTNPPSSLLFVGNLSYGTTERVLKEAFSKFGTVVTARIPTRDGKSSGFGYVQFASKEEASKAMDAGRFDLNGRMIRIDYDSEKPARAAPTNNKKQRY